MINWANNKEMWCSDKEEISGRIFENISNQIPSTQSYKEKQIIISAIGEELEGYSMFKDRQSLTESSLPWRLALIAWVPLQFFVLVPYCSVKWLFGRGWYLKSGSVIYRFHQRIYKNS